MKHLLVLCALVAVGSAALVHARQRREVMGEMLNSQTTQSKLICQPQTPCGWDVLNIQGTFDHYMTNAFCICEPDQQCTRVADDGTTLAHLCEAVSSPPDSSEPGEDSGEPS